MIFIVRTLVHRHVRQQRNRAGTLDGVRDLSLVPSTTTRDATGNDIPALHHQTPEPPHILVVDQVDLFRTELADLLAPESAPLHRLLRTRNGSFLLFLVAPAYLFLFFWTWPAPGYPRAP